MPTGAVNAAHVHLECVAQGKRRRQRVVHDRVHEHRATITARTCAVEMPGTDNATPGSRFRLEPRPYCTVSETCSGARRAAPVGGGFTGESSSSPPRARDDGTSQRPRQQQRKVCHRQPEVSPSSRRIPSVGNLKQGGGAFAGGTAASPSSSSPHS